jgi:hypothetical protein
VLAAVAIVIGRPVGVVLLHLLIQRRIDVPVEGLGVGP